MEAATVEVDALRSIFGDDLRVEDLPANRQGVLALEMKIRPMEFGEHSSASVRVRIELGTEYPSQSPLTYLLQPRGVDEKNLRELQTKISEHVEENLEMPVLFDIFQLVREFLEKVQSRPSASCPICLLDFGGEDASLCTDCEHFVHRHCFSTYIAHSKHRIKQELAEWPKDMRHKVDQALRCPVCRLELSDANVKMAEDEGRLDEWCAADAGGPWSCDVWREKQRELKAVFERQRLNGGLIDLEQERLRTLVVGHNVETETPSSAVPVSDGDDVENATSSAEERVNDAAIGGGRSSGKRTGGQPGFARHESRVPRNPQNFRREPAGRTSYGGPSRNYRYGGMRQLYVPTGTATVLSNPSGVSSFAFHGSSTACRNAHVIDSSPNV